jgi:dihydroorotase
MLQLVSPWTARDFARALVMPNTQSPIRIAEEALVYRQAVLDACLCSSFNPLMTIKIGPWTTPAIIEEAKSAGIVAGKVYPEGVTTNSDDGARSVDDLFPVFEAMEKHGMVLSLHGEDPDAFCLDREVAFLPTLRRIAAIFPRLKIVLEHITTQAAVTEITALPDTVAATITVHHLLLTLDDVVGREIDPHHFCKPLAKRPSDRDSLRAAALSGSPKFFLGTDSAPHALDKKEGASGCAGVFSAPTAIPLLAEFFEEAGCLHRLEAFTSEFGARFYDLPLNEGVMRLTKVTPPRVGCPTVGGPGTPTVRVFRGTRPGLWRRT